MVGTCPATVTCAVSQNHIKALKQRISHHISAVQHQQTTTPKHPYIKECTHLRAARARACTARPVSRPPRGPLHVFHLYGAWSWQPRAALACPSHPAPEKQARSKLSTWPAQQFKCIARIASARKHMPRQPFEAFTNSEGVASPYTRTNLCAKRLGMPRASHSDEAACLALLGQLKGLARMCAMLATAPIPFAPYWRKPHAYTQNGANTWVSAA